MVLLARTTGALEEIDDAIRHDGGQATLIPQDIRDFDKIDLLGPLLAEKFGGLDIFVGNAGVLGTLAPVGHSKAGDWQKVMDVNLNANFRLIRTLDPLLQAAPAGRVIFTTSGLGERPLAYWGAYGASKAGLNMLAQIYAAETQKTSLKINLVDPGVVQTALLDDAFPGGYQGKTRSPDDVVPAYLALADTDCPHHGEIIRAADY